MFFEERPRRSLPRPSPPLLLAAAAVLAIGAVVVVLLAREPAPEPVAPVGAASAETRLENQLRRDGLEDVGSVRCAGPIAPGRRTRCQLLYSDGDTQLMLVSLVGDGQLDIEVPYPAQRRPGQ